MKCNVVLAIAWDDNTWSDCNFVTVEITDGKPIDEVSEKELEDLAIAQFHSEAGFSDRIQKIWMYSHNEDGEEEDDWYSKEDG